MKNRPILFNGPMVRAILAGKKTQTRRLVKADFMHDPKGSLDAKWYLRGPRAACWDSYETLAELVTQHCPYGQPGDRLWVRENFCYADSLGRSLQDARTIIYTATHDGDRPRNEKPSIHMPRWASRITLEVTDVRVELLQDVSDEDRLAEGIYPTGTGLYHVNPWVWVVSFKRHGD